MSEHTRMKASTSAKIRARAAQSAEAKELSSGFLKWVHPVLGSLWANTKSEARGKFKRLADYEDGMLWLDKIERV